MYNKYLICKFDFIMKRVSLEICVILFHFVSNKVVDSSSDLIAREFVLEKRLADVRLSFFNLF